MVSLPVVVVQLDCQNRGRTRWSFIRRSSFAALLLACDEETKSNEEPPFAVEGGLRVV
jgi:hypothetical protein